MMENSTINRGPKSTPLTSNIPPPGEGGKIPLCGGMEKLHPKDG
jgi:hypothetical protein